MFQFLDREQIAFMLYGSMAMSIYTLPRATRDFDFVVHLAVEDVEKMSKAFSTNYYCDADAINDAIVRKSMFNIMTMQLDLRPILSF